MKKGFTLIELLIVITILAVLAGAALPYVQSYVAESRISKAKSDLDEIGRALAIYEAREGDYSKTDVSLLTGRYLNKAPIDPWGQPYFINASSGLVVSAGADRVLNNEDDVTFPYQPPLALVQVKWVDVNQTGAVDFQNASDTLQLIFSRKVQTPISGITFASIQISSASSFLSITADACQQATAKWLASRTLVLDVKLNDSFVPGSTTVKIITNSALKDLSGSNCITDQVVTIVPQ